MKYSSENIELQCILDLAIVQAMFLPAKTKNQCHDVRKFP